MLAGHYKKLANQMAQKTDHARNGFGRPRFEELCKVATKLEALEAIKLPYSEPSLSQQSALNTLAAAKGLKEPVCQHSGCNEVDCLEIHGDTVRHAQLYNVVVEVLPSKDLVYLKQPGRPLKYTTLVLSLIHI